MASITLCRFPLVRSVKAVADGFVRPALDTLMTWTDRALMRDHLARLGERELADIGISRSDVECESSKPFWRA